MTDKNNKQEELFSYKEFGNDWDKKFGEGEFARFEKKWNKRFSSTITLDHQLKQKITAEPNFFDSLPERVSSEDFKARSLDTGQYDLFRKLNPQDAVTGQLKEKVSKHATDKSWENTEGWNTLYNKEKI
jgi:hypothetical protein